MGRRAGWRGAIVGAWMLAALGWDASAAAPEEGSAERGRIAMTLQGFLRPAWGEDAYRDAVKFWKADGPDPKLDPEGYASAFRHRYGLHPAPYPNDGLPMGLRRGLGPGGVKQGLQIDCMVCHGGSIGGTSYVGLGNTTLDLRALLDELTQADGQRLPPSTFVLNSSRGTVNAGQIAAVLLSLRNADLSPRRFPLPLGTNLPEMDVPPWWHMARKATMYYDGRTDARSVRTNMQFMLGEKTLDEFKQLEPAFRDVLAYFKSLKPPKYPFAIDGPRAERGRLVFEKTCARCHGTYGPGGRYPNKIVALDVIGTDRARAEGLGERLVAHYNTTWFGEGYPVASPMVGYQAPPLDGIWATAPYLHNGSVPTLATLLDSKSRPSRFLRPPSTDFAHYDTENVGWKFEVAGGPPSPSLPRPEAMRYVDTARFGMGNGGHTFGDRLTGRQRRELIEYLKGL